MKTITDFFIEAAVRKGAPSDLLARAKAGTTERLADHGARKSSLNYKQEYFLGEDTTFTIYGDGSFNYDSPGVSVEGKLMPPHSRTWIRRMVRSGMAVDFAKTEWAEFYCLRHGS